MATEKLDILDLMLRSENYRFIEGHVAASPRLEPKLNVSLLCRLRRASGN
jgi:hypothetical protein